MKLKRILSALTAIAVGITMCTTIAVSAAKDIECTYEDSLSEDKTKYTVNSKITFAEDVDLTTFSLVAVIPKLNIEGTDISLRLGYNVKDKNGNNISSLEYDTSDLYATKVTFSQDADVEGVTFNLNYIITYVDSSKSAVTLTEKTGINFELNCEGNAYTYTRTNNIITQDKAPTANYNAPVTANTTIPTPSYMVTIPAEIEFGNVTQALPKYADEKTDGNGNPIMVSTDFNVSAKCESLFDKHLKVSIGSVGDTFNLAGTTSTINTTLYKDKSQYTMGETFATFEDSLNDGANNTQAGKISINRTQISETCAYTGTLTFNITVE